MAAQADLTEHNQQAKDSSSPLLSVTHTLTHHTFTKKLMAYEAVYGKRMKRAKVPVHFY